jgi:hypothetical protein
MGRRHEAAALVHVPHASTISPQDVRDQFVLTDDQIAHEIRLMTDRLTDELFAVSRCGDDRHAFARRGNGNGSGG